MLNGYVWYSLWISSALVALFVSFSAFSMTCTGLWCSFSSRFSAAFAPLFRFVFDNLTGQSLCSSTVSTAPIITTTNCINKITISKGATK